MSHPDILQLDSMGQPVGWINWKKAIQYQVTGDVSWSLGEIEFSFRGGHNKHGVQSVVTTASILAIKGHSHKHRHKPPTLTNRDLFRRDRYVCAYCGKKFPEHKLSRDHIIPTSKGGSDTWMNVVTSCMHDNQRKDDKTLEQAGMKLLYVPYVPSKAEHLILKNRNILGDQMEFLLGFVPDSSPLKKGFIHDK